MAPRVMQGSASAAVAVERLLCKDTKLYKGLHLQEAEWFAILSLAGMGGDV